MPAFFKSMDRAKPVFDVADTVVMVICKCLLLADIFITCLSVLGRFVPFIPDPAWTEEVVLTLMSYLAVLSAAIAIRHNAHIRMTAFDRYLPKNLVKTLDLLADVAVIALGFVMLVIGRRYALNMFKIHGTYASMPWLSRFYMYLPIPVAGCAMIIFGLETVYNHVKAFFVSETPQDEEHKDEKEGAVGA